MRVRILGQGRIPLSSLTHEPEAINLAQHVIVYKSSTFKGRFVTEQSCPLFSKNDLADQTYHLVCSDFVLSGAT